VELGATAVPIVDMLDAVFPIFRVSLTAADLAGTGFFVSAEGHFLTCSHTFEQMPGALYWVMPSGLAPIFIERCWKQPRFDLVTPKSQLQLSSTVPTVGSSAHVLGFKGREVPLLDGTPDFKGVADILEFEVLQPDIAKVPADGTIEAKHFPAIVTSSQGPIIGYSGGPLVDSYGDVLGVFSYTATSPDGRAHRNVFVDTKRIRVSDVALGKSVATK